MDKSTIDYNTKKAGIIKELAMFSVAYAIDKKQKTFRTDTLRDRKMRKKFNRNGYGGIVIITFANKDHNKISGLPDSTVIFKQISLRGVEEIIYDFAVGKKRYEDDTTNLKGFVFKNVTERIYYRRRPLPLM
ncbi:MAG TPA: hypothetical protein VK645_14660 [Chitinophagaceae bacterium]|nr:hypothetical protein [Chitinophagaceae bacterium]